LEVLERTEVSVGYTLAVAEEPLRQPQDGLIAVSLGGEHSAQIPQTLSQRRKLRAPVLEKADRKRLTKPPFPYSR